MNKYATDIKSLSFLGVACLACAGILAAPTGGSALALAAAVVGGLSIALEE